MRPTESEIKRYYLARGVFFLLKQFEMIGNSYAAIRQEEWKRRAPALLKRDLFTPSSHRPLDGVFRKVPGDGLYVKEIDPTFINYAISEDGVVMRAHRGHDAWRVAKLPPGHREHCRLLENYRRRAIS